MEYRPPPIGVMPTAAASETDTSLTEVTPYHTPFIILGPVKVDLALSRTIQEQEHAYMMLTMNKEEEGGFGEEAMEGIDGEELCGEMGVGKKARFEELGVGELSLGEEVGGGGEGEEAEE